MAIPSITSKIVAHLMHPLLNCWPDFATQQHCNSKPFPEIFTLWSFKKWAFENAISFKQSTICKGFMKA